MADLSAQQPQSPQLWRALLFLSLASHCCWDRSVNSCQGLSLTDTHTHTHKTMYACRHLRAHSGYCCPSGPCSAPEVNSSPCLCCRWCASSLGYPSFCWLGTSPLFPLPEEFRKRNSSQMQMVTHAHFTCPKDFIVAFPYLPSHVGEAVCQDCKANYKPLGRCSHARLPLLYSQLKQTLSGKWLTVWGLFSYQYVP